MAQGCSFWHGSNHGNTSAGRNSVGNALRGVPLAPERHRGRSLQRYLGVKQHAAHVVHPERHRGRSLQRYPSGRQIEPCPISGQF